MSEQRQTFFKPWMWMLLVVAISLLALNYDPVGDILENMFGKGAKQWAINIYLLAFTAYLLLRRR